MSTFINVTELDLQEETVVCINRVSKASTGGRSMRFNSVVVVGDGKGHMGLGFGKAKEVASAVNKARENAKRSIFKVNLINGTIPHQIDIKYSSVRLMLKPASPGTGHKTRDRQAGSGKAIGQECRPAILAAPSQDARKQADTQTARKW